MNTISDKEIQFFDSYGYLIKRNFVPVELIAEINLIVAKHLQARTPPFELEHEVSYPGSPKSLEAQGGQTIRRLLLAYQRDEIFKNWAENLKVGAYLRALLKSPELYFVPSHHNCIMTKQPEFSSETHWHKDVRYWSFNNTQLITTWLPLGEEEQNNGGLKVIPETHKWSPPADYLDERLFLRDDLPETQKWLEKAVNIELHQGDLLFFHAGLFHAAGKNQTNTSKNALVFTYHGENTQPLPETKSSNYPEIKI